MSKKEFIKELRKNLKHLQKEELDEIIADYEEHFEAGKADGRTEKEIAKSLGTPKKIAKHIVAKHLVKKAEHTTSPRNVLNALLASLGLGFFNLVFVLGPFLAIIGILVGIFAAGIGLTIGGLGAMIFMALNIAIVGVPHVTAFFLLLGIICLGLLILIGDYYLARLFGKLTLKYLKLNIHVVKHGLKK